MSCWRAGFVCLAACGTAPAPVSHRPAPVPAPSLSTVVEVPEPQREAPVAEPEPPADEADATVDAASYHYLDDVEKHVVGRILKEASTGGSQTEITVGTGGAQGVATDWRLAILDGATDTALAGGDITITRVEERVTVGVVKLPLQRLTGHTRVRFLPPRPAAPATPPKPTKAPHHIARIELHTSWVTLHCGNEHRYAIDWDGKQYASGTTKIDTALVDALVASQTGLEKSEADQKCIDHTDDYPELAIAYGEYPQTPEVVMTSASNCGPDNAPWNVLRGGKRLVQTSGRIGDAVHALLEAIDPAHWKASNPRFNWDTSCDPPRHP